MAIPGWALGLGAALKAPEVASDYMGLFKNVQALRDDANTSDELERIQQFQTPEEARAYKTDNYLSPTSRQTLEKLRAEKLDTLLRGSAAAPRAQVRELQMDPRFRDAESVAEIVKDPRQAVFGQNAPAAGGYMPTTTKGVVTAARGTNPYVEQELADFQTGNLSKLDRFRAAQGDRWAGAGLGKDEANAFKDVATGQKDYAGMDEKSNESKAEQDLGRFIADNPAPRTVEEWNAFWDKARKIPNLPLKLVTDQQAAMQGRNDKRIVGYKEIQVGNGPNSTVKKVPINFLGEVIEGVSATSSNNPSDRELGLVPTNTGNNPIDVSWVGADGTPQGSRIPQSELPALKSSLETKGIKEISTMNHKGQSKTETLIKPPTGRSKGLGDRPGGAPAAKATGGFTYVNGKLVPN